MRGIIFSALLVFVANVIAAPVVNIQNWRTENGVRVLFVKAPQIPMVDMAVIFKAGSIHDGNQLGLAALTNAMLNEGAGKRNVDELAQQFDDVGAQFDNNVSKETSVLTLRSLVKPDVLKSALENFSLILQQPTFPEGSVERLKQQIMVGLKAAQQQPGYLAGRAFAKAIWGTSVYANSTLGTVSSVPTLSRAEVSRFYHQYYVARNALVVIVGDVTRKKAEAMAEEVIGKFPRGEAAHMPMPVDTNTGLNKHIDFPSTQNTILIGELGVKRSAPDYLSLKVGNYILGGAGNLGSILMSNVREKYGLTYGVYSRFDMLSETGAFVINLKSRNDEAVRASNMTQSYLADFIAKGPTEPQLKAAKDYLVGSFPLGISSNSAILSIVADIGYYNLPLNYLDTYRKQVEAISGTKIELAFAKEVDVKRLVVLSVGGNTAGKTNAQ